MKITINNVEHEFDFRLKQIRNLEKKQGKKIQDILTEISKVEENGIDFDLCINIACEGIKGKEESDIENMFDESGLPGILEVMKAFNLEVINWLNPNYVAPTS